MEKDPIDQLARAGRVLLESGVPQEIIRAGSNVLTSMAQASATSPMMASASAVLIASALRRARIIGQPAELLVDGMAGTYLGGTVIGGVIENLVPGGPGTVPQSANISFDVPEGGPTNRLPTTFKQEPPRTLASLLAAGGGGLVGGAAGAAAAGAGAAGTAGLLSSGRTVSPIVIPPFVAQKVIDQQTDAFEQAGLLTPAEAERVRKRGPGVFGAFGS